MRKLFLSLSALALLSLTACKSDPIAPVVEPIVKDTSIRAGSTFTFLHQVYTDTAATLLELTDTSTYTVASIDTSFAGKLNNHYIWSLVDTSVYRVEADGNIAVYQPEIPIPNTGVVYPESWPVLPIVTKETDLITFEDDTLTTIQTLPAVVHTKLSNGYIGEGSVTVNGKSYATKEAFIDRLVSIGIQGQVFTTYVRTEYGYSPELKTFVTRKQQVESNHNFSPIPNGAEVLTLVKFAL
jgi:hypothetical protein